MVKVIKYVVQDIVKNRFVMGYALLLLALGFIFFGFESDPDKGLLSLLNINLIVVPLVCIIFATSHFYNSYEFLELLSAQPISRKTIFFGQYLGVCLSLSGAFVLGVGIPTMIYEGSERGVALILTGLLLTLVFVSLAFLASVLTRDKAKGIGVSLALWFYFCLVFDGLVLTVFLLFADYPMEKITLLFAALNPTDLARILVLIKLDVSALMGITGAVFQNFFTSKTGVIIAFGLLMLWVLVPISLAYNRFNKKDL